MIENIIEHTNTKKDLITIARQHCDLIREKEVEINNSVFNNFMTAIENVKGSGSFDNPFIVKDGAFFTNHDLYDSKFTEDVMCKLSGQTKKIIFYDKGQTATRFAAMKIMGFERTNNGALFEVNTELTLKMNLDLFRGEWIIHPGNGAAYASRFFEENENLALISQALPENLSYRFQDAPGSVLNPDIRILKEF